MEVVLAVALALAMIGPIFWARSLVGPHRGLALVGAVIARMLAAPILVVLPLLIWLGGLPLVEPLWHGALSDGWPSCLATTSYVWLPVVLWASAAMYSVVALDIRTPSWVRGGLLAGALAAGVMAASAWLTRSSETEEAFIPAAATAVAHAIAFALASREERPSVSLIAGAGTAALVSTAANVGAAMARLDRLAYQTPPSGCYVVTAATRGHAWLVRPLDIPGAPRGDARINLQLLVLRRLEEQWRATHSRSHGIARRAYDCIGPIVAARITSPWLADLAYVSLKPLEWSARCWLRGTP